MLKIQRYHEVTRLDLARNLPVRWKYRTVTYLVDGMILDTGCAQVRENPGEELKSKINYLEDLGDRVRELRQKGWSVHAIVLEVRGCAMMIEFLTLGHFSRRRLVLSYLEMNENGDDKRRLP